MPRDKDLELALQLQAQFDRETAQEMSKNNHGPITKISDSTFFDGRAADATAIDLATETMSIVDERWELVDPSPDMRAMFLEFNDKYFWGRLAGVEVRWSPRMTLCAGLCCYEGHGGLCSIRLSSPLLKLRPRKDLVETLLHEMIHAYLFVTANNKDHDGHGPEFCKHMNRLNKSTGTNISIYHNFHDEVDVYRQHWWRCNGPCQKKPPYNGVVRRSMNRAPSARDPWWAEHQRTCGGSYTKVKEPEGYGVKKGTKRKKEEHQSGSGNETKKRATEEIPFFPGKGHTIGGGSTTSRLITREPNTLDRFLRKTDTLNASSTPPCPLPFSPTKHQDRDEDSGSGKENLSRSSRLKALAAIFDSDSSDDEDIVIVKFGKPLQKNDQCSKDEDNTGSRAGTSYLTKSAGTSSNSTPGSPKPRHETVSKPRHETVSKPRHETVSKPRHETVSKPRHETDPPSRHHNPTTSTSHSSWDEHDQNKQDSIIDDFGRLRSGDLGTKDGEKVRNTEGSIQGNGYNRSNASLSTKVVVGGQGTSLDRHEHVDMVNCPVCMREVEKSNINQHLDQCLS